MDPASTPLQPTIVAIHFDAYFSPVSHEGLALRFSGPVVLTPQFRAYILDRIDLFLQDLAAAHRSSGRPNTDRV